MTSVPAAPDPVDAGDTLARPTTRAAEVLAVTARGVRETSRQPEAYVVALLMPILLFGLQVGALGDVADRAFGVQDYAEFMLPVMLLFAATWSAAGPALVMDIASGYWDKLCLTPVRRSSLVVGRVLGELVGVTGYCAVLLGFGLAIGVRFTGSALAVALLLVLFSLVFAIGYDAINIAVAMLTRSVRTTQSVATVLFFPLLFLSPWIVPRELMTGWFAAAVSLNPVTYIIEGARAATTGASMGTVWLGLAVNALFAAVTLTVAMAAFRRYARRR